MEGERRWGEEEIQWKLGKRESGFVQKPFPGEKFLKFPLWFVVTGSEKAKVWMRSAASQFGRWSFLAAEAGIQGSGWGRGGGTGLRPSHACPIRRRWD